MMKKSVGMPRENTTQNLRVFNPTTIQDLQTEINNLKREVKKLRQQQEIHQIILS